MEFTLFIILGVTLVLLIAVGLSKKKQLESLKKETKIAVTRSNKYLHALRKINSKEVRNVKAAKKVATDAIAGQ